MFPLQLTGPDYDAFVGEFIEAAVDKYGKSVMLQVSNKDTLVLSVKLQEAIKDTCVGIPYVKVSLFPLWPCHRQPWFAILCRRRRTDLYLNSRVPFSFVLVHLLSDPCPPQVRGFREQQRVPPTSPLAGKGQAALRQQYCRYLLADAIATRITAFVLPTHDILVP